MTDKSMFDILSKFDSAGSRTVNESAPATRSRSSSAGDPAMFDILSKFNDATLNEAGPGTYPSYSGDSGSNDIRSNIGSTTTDTGSSAYRQSMDTDLGTGKEVQNDMYTKDGEVTGSVASIVDPTTNQAQVVTQNNRYQADAESGAAVRDIERSYAAMQNDQPELDDMFDDIHDEPASEEEAEMAGDQAEYIKYAIDEIKDSIEAGNSFPEWFQNKLSGVYTTLKDLHGYMEGDKRNDADEMMFDDAPDMSDRMQQLRGMRNRDAEANFAKTHAKYGIDGADQASRMMGNALTHAGEFNDPRKMAQTAMNMGMSPERVDRTLPKDFKFDEDVVSKKQAAADVVGKKTAVDDIVQELSKSYADFVAQVEEERDDMSFFKKDNK